MEKTPDLVAYTDGGSRGNPGPAALGVVIYDSKGNMIKQYGEYIGEVTNNEAEYQAAISALKKSKSILGKEKAKTSSIHMKADSQLLVKQMKGEYKIEHARIQQLFLELWNLKMDFKQVSFEAVPREQNTEADRMVNEALDAKASSRSLL